MAPGIENTALIAAYAICFAVSFASALLILPRMIASFSRLGMVGKDQNKFNKPSVAEMGGVAVVIGLFIGVVFLMAVDSIVVANLIQNRTLFVAALIAALGCAFVGAIDDLFDLRQRIKAALPVVFGIPLGLYYTDTAIHLPRGVSLELGLLMVPLIAFMVSAGANSTNMLEGFNGLGAGLGLIMASAIAMLALYAGRLDALLLLVPFIGAAAGLLVYNRFPARIFPGDTFTLFMGATLVSSLVMIDLKEVGALLFVPMIAEFILKAASGFSAECYGVPRADGTLERPSRIASLTHVAMRAGARTERGVVRFIWALEIVVAVLVVGLIVF